MFVKEFEAFNGGIVREEAFAFEEVNKRFGQKLKEALIGKTYKEVRKILAEQTKCPVVKISTYYSKKHSRVKKVIVYGHHSSMWINFSKGTRKVSSIF